MIEASERKSCCAAAYQSDFARLLLGTSFHPGGLDLTAHVAGLAGIEAEDHVLDVASGIGDSALLLARRFGCRVTGIDLAAKNVAAARDRAQTEGLSVGFEQGDAERIPFDNARFDVVLCECAFCTFPDKHAAAREFARVLKAGGRLAFSDLTRSGDLPDELSGLLAWIACIGDARPAGEYAAMLEAAGFTIAALENHDRVLSEMIREMQARMLGAELLSKLRKIDLAGADFDEARKMAAAASGAIRSGRLGYCALLAAKA